ncbi:hypothetical protein ACF1A5_27295 [Streptomyces sp. NPDC014864]|uniref:hypothetical protein n=1 Tax=Streptomyces sp. NPDC014864 TaxID=3364924 RepID=UPI0036FF5DA7
MEARQAQRHFRGYNHTCVTAVRALELFWSEGALEAWTTALGERVGRALAETAGGTDCLHRAGAV